MKKAAKIILASLFLLNITCAVYAAVGCSLNDPDRDVKKIFPESSGYKTSFVTIKEKGGEALKKKIEEELGDTLEPVYENIDVPYAYYTVLKGRDIIGYIHGVNQKGKYGGMQLIMATDLTGKILNFYYQKMSSPEAGKFMDKSFTNQFIGLTLDDFMKGTLTVKNPSQDSHQDFQATLRGLRKNLILLEEFKPAGETAGKIE